MKKFVDNNYGKDMINTYRGLLFSNLERSRAKDIEDVETMNFVPQAAYGLSFNPLEYGIIPEAKNDTGIKLGDVINGAVGTQMGRYFQYSPKYEQTKIKFQPGKGKTIREKSAPMGYAYSREILDPWGGNYMFETTKKTEQTTPPTFVDSDVSTFNLPTIPDITDFNYGKFGGRFACGGLKKYDKGDLVLDDGSNYTPVYDANGKVSYYENPYNKYRYYPNGSATDSIGNKIPGNYLIHRKLYGYSFTPSQMSDGSPTYHDEFGNIYYNNGRVRPSGSETQINITPEAYRALYDINNSFFSDEIQKKMKEYLDAKIESETKPKQDVTGSTGIGNSTGADTSATTTTGTASNTSTSATGTGTPESTISTATNTPATNTPTTGTTTTPSQQVVDGTKLPLGYAAFNYGNRLWGSYNKDAVLKNDRLLRYDAGDNGIHIRYQRIPRKYWQNKNTLDGGMLPEVVVGNVESSPSTKIYSGDYIKDNKDSFYNPTKVGSELMLQPDFDCGGRKMALGGPDYMNVDTELTDVVNEDVINRNLNKAFINGQWVDLTDQSTVRDAKIAQPRRDNWWATDMAVYDGAKLLGNMYDAIQQNKQRNKVRSIDDIAFTNYADANPAYLRGSEGVLGDRGDYAQGVVNTANMVKPYHQYKCGGKYQNGGVYDLTPDEIREIYANGGRVEFLD